VGRSRERASRESGPQVPTGNPLSLYIYKTRENGRRIFKPSNFTVFTFEIAMVTSAPGPRAHNVPIPLFPVKLDYASLETYRESLSGYYGKPPSGSGFWNRR
jgi:hypothetical protein